MDEKEYAELKKRIKGLPSFTFLNIEFEISSIEFSEFALRDISKKIVEKVDSILAIFDSVLSPDTTSTSSLQESKIFSDSERNKVFDIFREFMIINREEKILDWMADDKKYAEFIIKISKDWKKTKDKVSPYLIKLKDAWKKTKVTHESIAYLG